MTEIRTNLPVERVSSPHLSKDVLDSHNRAINPAEKAPQLVNTPSKKSLLTKSETTSQASGRSGSLTSMLLMKRKLKRWRRGKMSNISVSDGDTSKQEIRHKEPTYKMEPDCKFRSKCIQEIMECSLKQNLEKLEQYDHARCSQLSQFLSEDIKQKVKALKLDRYKIVCNVIIGENQGQNLECASRAVWNIDTDNSATATFANKNIVAIAICYGMYYE